MTTVAAPPPTIIITNEPFNGVLNSGGSYSFSTGSTDPDEDGIADAGDNCPQDFNPLQVDTDMDGFGDVCDVLAVPAMGPAGFALMTLLLGGAGLLGAASRRGASQRRR